MFTFSHVNPAAVLTRAGNRMCVQVMLFCLCGHWDWQPARLCEQSSRGDFCLVAILSQDDPVPWSCHECYLVRQQNTLEAIHLTCANQNIIVSANPNMFATPRYLDSTATFDAGVGHFPSAEDLVHNDRSETVQLQHSPPSSDFIPSTSGLSDCRSNSVYTASSPVRSEHTPSIGHDSASEIWRRPAF